MPLGIIGKGNIGGTLGDLLRKTGHDIRFGQQSEPGSVAVAVRHGEAVIFAGYFGCWPNFEQANAGGLIGKVLIDAANPYRERDGAIVAKAFNTSTGARPFKHRDSPTDRRRRARCRYRRRHWEGLRFRAGRLPAGKKACFKSAMPRFTPRP